MAFILRRKGKSSKQTPAAAPALASGSGAPTLTSFPAQVVAPPEDRRPMGSVSSAAVGSETQSESVQSRSQIRRSRSETNLRFPQGAPPTIPLPPTPSRSQGRSHAQETRPVIGPPQSSRPSSRSRLAQQIGMAMTVPQIAEIPHEESEQNEPRSLESFRQKLNTVVRSVNECVKLISQTMGGMKRVIKTELIAELRDEVKAEIKAELKAELEQKIFSVDRAFATRFLELERERLSEHADMSRLDRRTTEIENTLRDITRDLGYSQ